MTRQASNYQKEKTEVERRKEFAPNQTVQHFCQEQITGPYSTDLTQNIKFSGDGERY